MALKSTWKPYSSLTIAPTNLKEAIDWVLRVTGKDGKKNAAASPPNFGCLCFLSKAVKDLLYDAKDPRTPGPSSDRYWDELLLEEEQDIVKPVLTDLGLVYSDSTIYSAAGGTEVIKALIDQLAQGLQKWVGWQEDDKCCLKGVGQESKGIGKKCDCPGSGNVYTNCCSISSSSGNDGKGSHDCDKCGKNDKKCYVSSYEYKVYDHYVYKTYINKDCTWPTISGDSTKVHLLARIFLGSVCLIWSGLSQLGWLTRKGSVGAGIGPWFQSTLSDEKNGLGSFMAAMGYDLERLNQGPGGGNGGKKGSDLWKLLSGQQPNGKEGIQWHEFKSGAPQDSVAEYYSSIYSAVTEKNTEKLCEQYPLLVLHILASGYFRAGSAGANKVTPKAPSSDPTKPRHPRTIREILYWLSALPYSEKYREMVKRMQDKYPKDENQYKLEGTNAENTTLKRDDITHYLMAACGYCPLVLIGIQGTIEKEVTQPAAGPTEKKPCPKHKKDPRSGRCIYKEDTKTADAAPQSPAGNGQPLKEGEICYGGYHLEVSKFGPLHGMYANGLFGFEMDISPAQCLDQLRVYVYHCFYQLYFLRKQCKVGVVENKDVLGWNSCRYGKDVYWSGGYSRNQKWLCETPGPGAAGNDCQCKKSAGHQSPLMCFLCDGLGPLVCGVTVGKTPDSDENPYPEIGDHFEAKDDIRPSHFGKPPMHCPVPMGWSAESGIRNTSGQNRVNHFKDLTKTHKTADLTGGSKTYPAHCTGNTLSLLLAYYCDPASTHGTLVVLLRLLACITPTVPRTLGDLFGFYYYIVYIGGKQGGGSSEVKKKLQTELQDVRLSMLGGGGNDAVLKSIEGWKNGGDCSSKGGNLKCLTGCSSCANYLTPLSGQQYGQLSPLMAGTYLSWLVYLIGEFQEGMKGLETAFKDISCTEAECKGAAGTGCNSGKCTSGTHGDKTNCCGCTSVVPCTGVLPVLYKYGFGYGNVTELHKGPGPKKCHQFQETLKKVLTGDHLRKGSQKGLHHEINQLIYTTRLPWIFVLTLAWLVAVLYLAFGAIWPLDWTHMRSHCRGWFRKGSLSSWEVLMVGKKKGRGILEFFN